jgi:hypothetical protein
MKMRNSWGQQAARAGVLQQSRAILSHRRAPDVVTGKGVGGLRMEGVVKATGGSAWLTVELDPLSVPKSSEMANGCSPERPPR